MISCHPRFPIRMCYYLSRAPYLLQQNGSTLFSKKDKVFLFSPIRNFCSDPKWNIDESCNQEKNTNRRKEIDNELKRLLQENQNDEMEVMNNRPSFAIASQFNSLYHDFRVVDEQDGIDVEIQYSVGERVSEEDIQIRFDIDGVEVIDNDDVPDDGQPISSFVNMFSSGVEPQKIEKELPSITLPKLDFSVVTTGHRAKSSALLFDCTWYNEPDNEGENLNIAHVAHFDSKYRAEQAVAELLGRTSSTNTNRTYAGPTLSDLSPEINNLWYDYLIQRGVVSDLIKFMVEYAQYKEHREYVRWLQRLIKHVG